VSSSSISSLLLPCAIHPPPISWFTWPLFQLTLHPPPVMCPTSFHISLSPKRKSLCSLFSTSPHSGALPHFITSRLTLTVLAPPLLLQSRRLMTSPSSPYGIMPRHEKCFNPLPPPVVFRHMSSSVTPLTPHHFLSHPADPGTTIPLRAPSFALASTQMHQAVQAHPGASARSLPHPKSAKLAGPSSIPMISY